MTARTTGSVLVIGTGLLGASIGLGLRQQQVEVLLEDSSPSSVDLAVDYGAGRRLSPADSPALVVVAVPPDRVGEVVAAALQRFPRALVTDVASVKQLPLEQLQVQGADLGRYLGSHPLAGRERGGAISARADLFLGRPWVITPHSGSTVEHRRVLEALILDLGAVPTELPATEHDRAVALISHLPHLIATLMAARLVEAPPAAINLAGQGLRDVTRIAASDPELWVQILGANAAAIVPMLRAVQADLTELVGVLTDPAAPGARRLLADRLAIGNTGVARLPGKHGRDDRFSALVVLIDDTPGQLARLLTEVGELGVNLEDLRLEHSPGAPIGIVELSVLPEKLRGLEADLVERGWRIAG